MYEWTIRKQSTRTLTVQAETREEALEKANATTKGWKVKQWVTCGCNHKAQEPEVQEPKR